MVHMSQNLRMPADHIAMFIPSPRVDGPVHVKTVKNVLDRHEVFSTVAVLRTPRRVKMAPRHIRMLLDIAKRDPFLFLDEIADKLNRRSGVAYLPNLCYVEHRRQGHSLKVMRRRAQQRDEYHQFLYWSAVAERTNSRLQLCFADETGIDGRSSRR